MDRSIARTAARAGAAAALALLAACQGGSTATSASSDTASLSVHLVDGPAVGYTQLNLHIERVELSTATTDGGAWTTLGTPNRTVNLLSLTGGVVETLVNGASIPAGSYGQLRLILGPGNTLCTEALDESGACPATGLHDLKVPSGLQTGVKIPVDFDVQPGTTKDVFIDFDAHRSVFVHATGRSSQYILRPVVRGCDKLVTGAVAGAATDAGGTTLAGVELMAETLDGQGNPTVVRSTKTAADGSYVLDLLPIGGSYFVVGQPRAGTVAYQAAAVGPFPVTATAPVVTGADVAFTKATATGGVDGTIAPIAQNGALDEVTVLGGVPVGAASHTFVLRETGAILATDGSSETWSIDLLPPAAYHLFVTRATPMGGGGGYTYATGPFAAATVDAGATTHVALAAP